MKLRSLLRFLRTHGLPKTFAFARYRLSEAWNDRYFGIDTRAPVRLDAFDIRHDDYVDYMPTSYRGFRAAMRHVPVGPGDAFVEFGAGKGRIVVLAATYGFKRVVGVELLPALAREARENIARARARLRVSEIQIVEANALEYDLPDDATVLHLYSPFHGDTLVQWWDRIQARLRRAPRSLTILFANPRNFDPLVADCPWLRKRIEMNDPPVDPGGNGYCIYTFTPDGVPAAANGTG